MGGGDLDRDGDALALLHAARRVRRGLPILLYVPASGAAMKRVANAVAAYPDASVQAQRLDGEDLKLLTLFFQAAMAAAPASRVLDIVLTARPDFPRRCHPAVRVALDHLLADARPSVSVMADVVGLSVRQFERIWPEEPFPRPKRLLLWLEVLLMAMLARTEQCPIHWAALRLGHNEKSFTRLRTRLGLPLLGALEPLSAFAAVREAFTAECEGEGMAKAL